ncbi:hypothetical protein HK104_011043 [Borealophlyctis nickersoniae]|nr:hypothetical protein HK104_011043 [Borealophlyctis nickersoniae]
MSADTFTLITPTPDLLRSRLSAIFHPKPHIPDADWVVFEHGTVVITTADPITTRDSLISFAKTQLQGYEHGPIAGTPLGDFNCLPQNSTFPDDSVWMIQFDKDNVFALVELGGGVGYDEERWGARSLRVGLEGRERRTLDAQGLNVVGTSRDDVAAR